MGTTRVAIVVDTFSIYQGIRTYFGNKYRLDYGNLCEALSLFWSKQTGESLEDSQVSKYAFILTKGDHYEPFCKMLTSLHYEIWLLDGAAKSSQVPCMIGGLLARNDLIFLITDYVPWFALSKHSQEITDGEIIVFTTPGKERSWPSGATCFSILEKWLMKIPTPDGLSSELNLAIAIEGNKDNERAPYRRFQRK